MRVLAVVPSLYDTSPGQRFRIEQWESILGDHGIELVYSPFETDGLRTVLHERGRISAKISKVVQSMRRRDHELRALDAFDLVYLFREAALLGPPLFERKLGRSGVPLVFDFDDAIFHAYKSPSNGYLSYFKFPAKTAEICRLSTHVMAGNEYLADYARPHNQHVTIVPTTIDTEKYTVQEKRKTDVVTIGWSGSFSTIQHLDTIKDVLTRLAKKERFRLRVIGTTSYEIAGVDTQAIQWKSQTEIADLSQIDIGLMPLPDENWSRGKCGLKALQYMALGIPTVCSPVGVNSTIINDGKNGYLASTSDEWIDILISLIRSPEKRRSIGLAGRETVEQEYSAKVIAPKVAEIFHDALRSKVNL